MEYIIDAEWEDQNVKRRWRTDKLQVMAIDHRTHWSQMSYKEINPPLHQELIFYMMKTKKKNHFEILIFILYFIIVKQLTFHLLHYHNSQTEIEKIWNWETNRKRN